MVMVRKTKDILFKEPQSEAEYINLGNELIAWAQQEDSLIIDGFPLSKMIAPSTFHALPAKSEQFAQSYDVALRIIGSRRERLAHEGLLNVHIVRETMPLYDPVYRKWIMNQKNGDQEEPGKTKFVIVKMPHYYSCPDGSHAKEAAAFVAQEERNAQQEILSAKTSNKDVDW
jgi:hypothetical protein